MKMKVYYRYFLTLLIVLSVTVPMTAWSGNRFHKQTVEIKNGLLTIDVKDMQFDQVLQKIGKTCGISFHIIGTISQKTITCKSEHHPAKSLTKFLSGFNYSIVYDEGQIRKIYIFSESPKISVNSHALTQNNSEISTEEAKNEDIADIISQDDLIVPDGMIIAGLNDNGDNKLPAMEISHDGPGMVITNDGPSIQISDDGQDMIITHNATPMEVTPPDSNTMQIVHQSHNEH